YAEGREATVSRESVISGLPIAIPALDIHTLGAGGGSLAWIDPGGALRVGPGSAGSEPGPACYGRGGERPAVTDANVVVGRLGAALLGGRLELDTDASHRAIERDIARPLGLSVVDAARGVVDVVNASMAKGMHLMSVARGRDPRNLGIVAFGGAGPLHACELAYAIGCREVIVPVLPGTTSAMGLVFASILRERSETLLAPLATFGDRAARAVLDRLAERVAADLADDGARPEAIEHHAVARVSYEGQRYQLDVPIAGAEWASGNGGLLAPVAERFRAQHLSSYGYARE